MRKVGLSMLNQHPLEAVKDFLVNYRLSPVDKVSAVLSCWPRWVVAVYTSSLRCLMTVMTTMSAADLVVSRSVWRLITPTKSTLLAVNLPRRLSAAPQHAVTRALSPHHPTAMILPPPPWAHLTRQWAASLRLLHQLRHPTGSMTGTVTVWQYAEWRYAEWKGCHHAWMPMAMTAKAGPSVTRLMERRMELSKICQMGIFQIEIWTQVSKSNLQYLHTI